ncbi:3'-5' exonuclease, partial [Streptomyces sp. DT18]
AEELARARPGAALTDHAAEHADRPANQHAPTVDGVTLASLHAAKGLDWDAGFLVGLAEGLLPVTYAQTEAQVEEERRRFY